MLEGMRFGTHHDLRQPGNGAKRFGIDLMLPIFFAAMLVQIWRGPRRAIGWAVAGGVALVAAQLVAGWWFIVIGAVAGSIVGGFVDDVE